MTAVTAVCTVACGALTAGLAHAGADLCTGAALTDPVDALVAVACLVAALAAGRLTLCGTAVVAARLLPARPGRPRWAASCALAVSPAWLRPLVAAALASALTVGVAGVAGAAAPAGTVRATTTLSDGSGHRPATPVDDPAADALPAAGWSAPPPPAHARRPADLRLLATHGERQRHDAAPVVVRRGDSLWSLAARQLGPHADDAAVTAQWHRWWHLNRQVVGDDPDLLRPGTVLVPAALGQELS